MPLACSVMQRVSTFLIALSLRSGLVSIVRLQMQMLETSIYYFLTRAGVASVVAPAVRILDMVYGTRITLEDLARR